MFARILGDREMNRRTVVIFRILGMQLFDCFDEIGTSSYNRVRNAVGRFEACHLAVEQILKLKIGDRPCAFAAFLLQSNQPASRIDVSRACRKVDCTRRFAYDIKTLVFFIFCIRRPRREKNVDCDAQIRLYNAVKRLQKTRLKRFSRAQHSKKGK